VTHATEIPADLTAALADRYTLGRVLGRGGMATVYLADDRKHASLQHSSIASRRSSKNSSSRHTGLIR